MVLLRGCRQSPTRMKPRTRKPKRRSKPQVSPSVQVVRCDDLILYLEEPHVSIFVPLSCSRGLAEPGRMSPSHIFGDFPAGNDVKIGFLVVELQVHKHIK